MDMQEAYDYVKAKILEQGRASFAPINGCLYRHPDGARCAIGWLISDDEYSPEMEELAVTLLGDLPSLEGLPATFLQDLQVAHDHAAIRPESFIERYITNMEKVAREWKLNP